MLEDGFWCTKGPFNSALEDDEELEWINVGGTPTVIICAVSKIVCNGLHQHQLKARQEIDTQIAHASHKPPVSVSTGKSAEHSKNELIALLNIPEHLTRETNSKALGIRQYYSRYKACLDAQQTLAERVNSGTWPGRKPTATTIIELFASKSTWFAYVVPGFSDINNFPVIKEWLEGQVGCPSDVEIWGKRKGTYTFVDLKEEKERRGNNIDKGKSRDKGEGPSQRLQNLKKSHKRRAK